MKIKFVKHFNVSKSEKGSNGEQEGTVLIYQVNELKGTLKEGFRSQTEFGNKITKSTEGRMHSCHDSESWHE